MQSRVSAIPRRFCVADQYAASRRTRALGRLQWKPWVPCWEVAILFLICTLDMLSSALLFQQRLAVEANPVLRPFAEAGLVPFVSAKLITFVPALLAADWYSRRKPEFIQNLLRVAIVVYVGIYALAVVGQLLG